MSDELKPCEECGRTVAVGKEPAATGFLANCGRRLMDRSQLNALVCEGAKNTRPAPAGDVVEAICRAACRDEGSNPDDIMPDNEPRWKDRAYWVKFVLDHAALTDRYEAGRLDETVQAAANIGYLTCAKERHVKLGDKVRADILALRNLAGGKTDG